MKKMSVSMLIPAYNEEKLLEKTALDLYSYLNSLKKKSAISSFEIIICINGSTDRTEEISKNLSKKHKEILYISMEQRGMGIALTAGMKKASKNIMIFVPADGEFIFDFIGRAIPLMDKYQIINCSRFMTKQPHGSNPIRILLSHAFREFFRLMFKYKFSEVGSSKVIRSDAARILIPHLKGYGGNWHMDVLYYSLKYKFKIKEIPLNIQITRPLSEAKVNLLKETWRFFHTCLGYGIKIYLRI